MMACGTRELKAHPEAADRMCAGAETAEEKKKSVLVPVGEACSLGTRYRQIRSPTS